ncbi:MAG: S8 family peptidase, partial [Pseudomonadota bacterium]
VAVIDTGVDYTHPDLAANIWINPGEVAGNGVDDDGNGYIDDLHGINALQDAVNKGDPMDDNRHGTHVAGTIGAVGDNGVGISGIAKQVKIMPIKFMDAGGSGRLSDAITAIDYMVTMKTNYGVNIAVSNNSWGGGGYSQALEAAIQRAQAAGIVFVAAAGNDAADIDLFPSYPASYEVGNVVAVAAIDRDQNLASFSNYGGNTVDVAAPGVAILSTLPGGAYGLLSGTSMAAPHVAGVLALLFSAQSGLGVEQALTRLSETGRDLASLASGDGAMAYVRTRRVVNADRLLRDDRSPLPDSGAGAPKCTYTVEAMNLATGGAIDTAADSAAIINQADEGGYYQVSLPFNFPFFDTVTRSVYLSPNGVVYMHQPRGVDYQVAKRAPNFSIAALHTDLTPRAARHGVRVNVANDRVTVYWLSEQYSTSGQGPVTVRLSLYPSGKIYSTVTFEEAANSVALSHKVLGNALTNPPTAPMGVVGLSAHSISWSNTVDIADVQRRTLASASDRFELGVTMTSSCVPNSLPEAPAEVAKLQRIRLRATSQSRLRVDYSGLGSGRWPVTAKINGQSCAQPLWATIADGRGSARLRMPAGVRRVSLASGSARGSLSVRNSSYSLKRVRFSRMCDQLTR